VERQKRVKGFSTTIRGTQSSDTSVRPKGSKQNEGDVPRLTEYQAHSANSPSVHQTVEKSSLEQPSRPVPDSDVSLHI
jgi:hypothetical protein